MILEKAQVKKQKDQAEDYTQGLIDWIKDNLEPDQLILEFYTPGEPNSGWIHCSWIPEGRTKYKPVTGSAKDLV